jgi:hypothetical protein
MKKTSIQLKGGNKIRRQSCKIEWQTCACKTKISFFYLEEIGKIINNSWSFHLKSKEEIWKVINNSWKVHSKNKENN